MKGNRSPSPQPVALFDAGPTSFRCSCGGNVTMGSEPFYGRTLERCDGPCGYVGRPRLDAETATLVAAEREATEAKKTPRPCSGGCGKMLKNPRRGRCHVCEREGRGNDLAPHSDAKPVAPIAADVLNDPVIAEMRAEAEAKRAKYRVCETEGCENRCSRAQDTICGRCGSEIRRQRDVSRLQKKKGAAA